MTDSGRAMTITRRAAIGSLAAAGLGFVAFGPRGRPENAGNRLVLDYWEKWTGLEGEAMQAIVDDFNRSQDRLFVRYLVTGTIHQKALIAIAGGNPPDIVGLYAFNVPSYAEANAVLPLDELAPKFGLTLDQYAAGMRQVMTYGGKWWATINTGGTLALYYNKALFRSAGLDPEAPPRTIAELDRAHKALTVVGGSGQIERAGFLHMEPGWWSWFWGYQFGGPLYDPVADRSLADSPATVRAYQWVQNYTRELGVENVERFRSGLGNYGTARQAFLTGQVAMVVQGPWLANQIRAFAPEMDYGVAAVPVSEEILDPAAPVAIIDTDVLMIPRGVREPEACMEFIAFTQRQENVERLALAHCKGSPMVKVSDGFLAAHPNRGVRLHNQLAASPRAYTAPPTPAWTECKDVFDTAMADMWKLRAPAAEILADVGKRSQAILDRGAAARRLRGEQRLAPVGGGEPAAQTGSGSPRP